MKKLLPYIFSVTLIVAGFVAGFFCNSFSCFCNAQMVDRNIKNDAAIVTTNKPHAKAISNSKKNKSANTKGNENKKQNDITLTLTYGKKFWKFSGNNYAINTNVHTILDDMFRWQKSDNRKIDNFKQIRQMGFDNYLALDYVFKGFGEQLDSIINQIEYPAQNSIITFDAARNIFLISKSKSGLTVDKTGLLEQIEQKIKTEKHITIEIPTHLVSPDTTEEMLQNCTKMQSHFSTNCQNSTASRKNNIRLAVKKLNGCKIEPNQIFSFNKTVGNRTKENGFSEANIIVDKKFVKGTGGGVCQVSTTLYNAMLLANLSITEVHHHSIPVHYVPLSLDAMVNYNSADLKFKNTSGLPIFIKSNFDGNNITFEIYGHTNLENYQIKTRSETTKVIKNKGDKIMPDSKKEHYDKIMFKGEFFRLAYPRDGYKSKSYLQYFKNDTLVKEKLIRQDTYDFQYGIVFEGTDTLPKDMNLPQNTTQSAGNKSFIE